MLKNSILLYLCRKLTNNKNFYEKIIFNADYGISINELIFSYQ